VAKKTCFSLHPSASQNKRAASALFCISPCHLKPFTTFPSIRMQKCICTSDSRPTSLFAHSQAQAHLIPHVLVSISVCMPIYSPIRPPQQKTRRDKPLPFLPLGERQSSRGERWRLCIAQSSSIHRTVWFPTSPLHTKLPTNPYQKENWGFFGPTSRKLKK
jgi:hypothetical protein